MASSVLARLIVFVACFGLFARSLPVSQDSDEDPSSSSSTSVELLDDSNATAKDLYVIKTIVYEVGILTDAENVTDNSTETHEQIDLTFFDPVQNGNQINLSSIPIPIQTNISGVTVTGIAKANLGTIQLGTDGEPATYSANFPLNVPILPNALISVKQNISTTNDEKSAQLLSELPEFLQLTGPISGEPIRIEPITESDSEEDGTKNEVATENLLSVVPKDSNRKSNGQ